MVIYLVDGTSFSYLYFSHSALSTHTLFTYNRLAKPGIVGEVYCISCHVQFVSTCSFCATFPAYFRYFAGENFNTKCLKAVRGKISVSLASEAVNVGISSSSHSKKRSQSDYREINTNLFQINFVI